MKIGVSLKINVTEIDKARLFPGNKGKYLDATVFVDINEFDQYGNSGMITQDVSKDEKAQGVKGNILGNCKVFWSDGGGTQQSQQHSQQQQQPGGAYQQHNQRAQQQAPQQAKPQDFSPGGDKFSDDIPF